MNNHGQIEIGSTIYGYFSTHDSTGANVAPSSAFEAADVIVYEDNSATQITAGITVTSPFDAETGFHHYAIDTNNSDYERGKQYTIVLAPDETVDSAAITAMVIGLFNCHCPVAAGGFNTTIATWTSNTDFTLTAGPAVDDALNGYTLVGLAVQGNEWEKRIQMTIDDYTGSTKTIASTVTHGTLTLAANDYVQIIPNAQTRIDMTQTLPASPTADTSGDALKQSTREEAPKKNTALNNIPIYAVLASDHVTPATGKTLTIEISQDGGAFAAMNGSSTITEVSDGLYQLDLVAADMNADTVVIKATEGTIDPVLLTISTVD